MPVALCRGHWSMKDRPGGSPSSHTGGQAVARVMVRGHSLLRSGGGHTGSEIGGGCRQMPGSLACPQPEGAPRGGPMHVPSRSHTRALQLTSAGLAGVTPAAGLAFWGEPHWGLGTHTSSWPGLPRLPAAVTRASLELTS